jgi:hypothetical protein
MGSRQVGLLAGGVSGTHGMDHESNATSARTESTANPANSNQW